jgi:hypothetical protein
MTPQSEYPYGDSFEALPARGDLPAVILSSTVGVPLDRPAHTILRRHILGEPYEAPALSKILCAAFLVVVRVPGWPLADRICIVLHKTVMAALCLSLRVRGSNR